MGRAAAAAARMEVEVTGAAKAAAAAARVAGAVAATAAVAAVEARVGGGSGRSRERARRRAGIWQGRPDSWCRGRYSARSPGTGSSCVLRPATSSHSLPARLPRRATRHQGSSRSLGQGPGLRLLWPGWTRPEAVASTVRPNPPEPHSTRKKCELCVRARCGGRRRYVSLHVGRVKRAKPNGTSNESFCFSFFFNKLQRVRVRCRATK